MAKKPTRIKAPAVPVPQTREEADKLIGEIGAFQRDIDLAKAAAEEKVAAVKAALEEEIGGKAAEMLAKFQAVMAFASANRDTLLEKGRKSVELSQGQLGWRLGNPTVKLARGVDEDSLVATFERLKLDDLLRVTTSLDRQAILKEPKRIEGIAGITVEQDETFFVKPLEVTTETTAKAGKLIGDAVQPVAA